MVMTAPSRRPLGRATSPVVGRLAFVDQVRGLALCGMVIFHVAWDLTYWGWTATGPAQSPAWMAFGHVVASTFLFISGYCLVLAQPRGTMAALRRIILLAGAAGLISLSTFWLFPEDLIFFGIIHCIALANLIGLCILRLPPLAILAVAGLAALAPSLVSSYGFEGLGWWWLGLSHSVPTTLDYRPLLPWLAPVLVGVSTARLLPRPPHAGTVRGASGLAWAGRHSLWIYLLHQPILFGLFFLAATLHPRVQAAAVSDFSRQCVAECVKVGAGDTGCAAACDCMLDRIQSRQPPPAPLAPKSNDLEQDAKACRHDH